MDRFQKTYKKISHKVFPMLRGKKDKHPLRMILMIIIGLILMISKRMITCLVVEGIYIEGIGMVEEVLEGHIDLMIGLIII